MKEKLHKAKEGTILYNMEESFSYRKNEEKLHNKSNEGPIFAWNKKERWIPPAQKRKWGTEFLGLHHYLKGL
jgi:hypothetical protein